MYPCWIDPYLFLNLSNHHHVSLRYYHYQYCSCYQYTDNHKIMLIYIYIFFFICLDPSICLVFSFSGIIFLSSIYYLVRKNSPYLKLNETSSSDPIDNEFIAEGILNSIFMYCICAAISAFFMYRSSFQRQRDRRFED